MYRPSKAKHPQSTPAKLINQHSLRDSVKRKNPDIIYQSNAFNMHMFPIKRILQQLDHIMPNRIFRREAFGPCEQ